MRADSIHAIVSNREASRHVLIQHVPVNRRDLPPIEPNLGAGIGKVPPLEWPRATSPAKRLRQLTLLDAKRDRVW